MTTIKIATQADLLLTHCSHSPSLSTLTFPSSWAYDLLLSMINPQVGYRILTDRCNIHLQINMVTQPLSTLGTALVADMAAAGKAPWDPPPISLTLTAENSHVLKIL